MNRYDFKGCAKRLGGVLIGRPEPSVELVKIAAAEIRRVAIIHPVTLRAFYNAILAEPLPEDIQRALESLPEHPRSYVPPAKRTGVTRA